MKVIYRINGNIKPKENTKHIINFFGVLGCIEVNALGKGAPNGQESKLVKHFLTIPISLGSVNKISS